MSMIMYSGYSQVPLTDPDAEKAFTYTPGDPSKHKNYKSIYDYSSVFDENKVEEPPAPEPSSFIFTCMTTVLTCLCYIGFVLTLPISGWFCLKTVHNYERLVIFRLGHLKGAKGPGLCLVLPCIDRIVKVDLRMKAFSVPPQKILTNDNAAIEGGADVYYRVAEPVVFVTGVQDLDISIRALSLTILQNHLSTQSLSDIEGNKTTIGSVLQESINKTTKSWGVEVGKIEISQIKVIQGPTVNSTSQAHQLLNMVAPGLVPAGTTPSIPAGMGMFPQAANATSNPNQNIFTSLMAGMNMPGTDTSPQGNVAMTVFASPRELISKVQSHLSPEIVREFEMVYKFTVEGEDGGTFYLDLKHGSGSAGVGELQGIPDSTLTLTTETMNRIMGGELSAFAAYMSGELKICGDVQGAMKLGQLLERIK